MSDKNPRYRGTSAADDITGRWIPNAKIPPVLKDFYRARDGPDMLEQQIARQKDEQEHLTPSYKPPPEWREETDRELFALNQMKWKRDIAMAQAAAARSTAEKHAKYKEADHQPIRTHTLEPSR